VLAQPGITAVYPGTAARTRLAIGGTAQAPAGGAQVRWRMRAPAGLAISPDHGTVSVLPGRQATVTLTVTDDDGGVGTASTKVAVLSTAQALNAIAGYVQNLPSLNAGQKNSLTVKLNAAAASASRGDMKTSNNQVNAFLNELQAYVNTGKVSALDAANLRGAVYAVKGSIGMYNRFLEWWPLGI